MSKRLNCKQCRKKRIPLLAVVDGDVFCSAVCCKRFHGVEEPGLGASTSNVNHAKSPRSKRGSYNADSDGQATRMQLEALERDSVARTALGMR